MQRAGLLLVLSCVSVFGPSGVAAAESCTTLARQLAAAQRAAPRSVQRYDTAIRNQRTELEKTTRMATKGRCATSRSAACERITEATRTMQQRLAALQRSRKRLASTGRGNEVKRIRARMRAAGCGRKTGGTKIVKIGPNGWIVSNDTLRPLTTGGAVRTMCVRTCDGYFFPISNSVAPNRAPNDAVRCAAQCPRADTELFVQPIGTPIGEMTTLSGAAYGRRPYAFRHQSPDYSPSPACTCGRALDLSQTGLRGTVSEPVPIPALRPIAPNAGWRNADPESRRNEAVGFDWRLAKRFGTPVDPTRPVRVVGPRYLPDR